MQGMEGDVLHKLETGAIPIGSDRSPFMIPMNPSRKFCYNYFFSSPCYKCNYGFIFACLESSLKAPKLVLSKIRAGGYLTITWPMSNAFPSFHQN